MAQMLLQRKKWAEREPRPGPGWISGFRSTWFPTAASSRSRAHPGWWDQWYWLFDRSVFQCPGYLFIWLCCHLEDSRCLGEVKKLGVFRRFAVKTCWGGLQAFSSKHMATPWDATGRQRRERGTDIHWPLTLLRQYTLLAPSTTEAWGRKYYYCLLERRQCVCPVSPNKWTEDCPPVGHVGSWAVSLLQWQPLELREIRRRRLFLQPQEVPTLWPYCGT